MSREIYDIINDMADVLNASQMQKLQEILVERLSENNVSDYLQTTNAEFLDMFLTAKHLEGCSDKTIRYYRCNIEKMLETINIPVIKITTEIFLLSTGIRVGELVRLIFIGVTGDVAKVNNYWSNSPFCLQSEIPSG